MDILKVLEDDLKDGAKTIHDTDLDDNMRRSIEEITRLREQLADAEKVLDLLERTAELANHPDPNDTSWQPSSDLLDKAFNEYRKKYGGKKDD